MTGAHFRGAFFAALAALALAAAPPVAADTRAAASSLQAPNGSTLIADFTDGTHTLTDAATSTTGDVWYNAGHSNATTRTASIGSDGVMLAMEAGANTTYMSWAYAPASPISLADSDWLAVELDFPEGSSTYASQTLINVQALVVTSPRTPKTTYTSYVGQKSLFGTADKMPHRVILDYNLAELRAAGAGGTFNSASVARIELRFVYNTTTAEIPTKVYVRKLWKGKNRTQVILTWANIYDGVIDYAYPTLHTAGLRGNVTISAQRDFTLYIPGDHLTKAEVDTLYADGWAVGVEQDLDVNDQPVALGTITRSGTAATFTPSTQQANSYVTAAIASGRDLQFYAAAQTGWNAPFSSSGASINASTGVITFTEPSGALVTPSTGFTYIQRLTKAELQAAYRNSLATIIGYGWTRGNEHCSWSGGAVGDLVWPWAEELGFKHCHGASTGTTPMQRIFDPRMTTARSLLMLPIASMDNVTAATLLGYLDTAEARGSSIIFAGHDLDTAGAALTMASGEFDKLVNGDAATGLVGLKQRQDQGRIDVITYDQFSANMVGRRRAAP